MRYFFTSYSLQTLLKHHVTIKRSPTNRIISNKTHTVITFPIFQKPLNQWRSVNSKYEKNTYRQRQQSSTTPLTTLTEDSAARRIGYYNLNRRF